MTVSHRITPKIILDAAVELAEVYGYHGVFKRHLSEKLGCAMGSINYHWKTMTALRAAMVVRAKQLGRHKIITQAATAAITK